MTAELRELLLLGVGKCTWCCHVVKEEEFREEAAKYEFVLSGLCQQCQDRILDTRHDWQAYLGKKGRH